MEPIEIHVRLSPDDEVLALRIHQVSLGSSPAVQGHFHLEIVKVAF